MADMTDMVEMTDEELEALPLSAFMQVDEAAQMLGYKRNYIYTLIRQKRLRGMKKNGVFLILRADVEGFEPNPRGRARTKDLPWRVYQDARLVNTAIDVQVREGKYQRFLEKLQAIQDADELHVFPGSIARYVLQGDEGQNRAHISFFWKSTEMPEEKDFQANLEAFKAELADVVDWDTAQTRTREALLYT